MIWNADRALRWILLLGVLASGCRTPSQSVCCDVGVPLVQAEVMKETEGAEPRPFLLPAEALTETFVMRQTVTVRWSNDAGQAEEVSFDAAIQRQGGSLLLLGLGPMGGVGFTLSLAEGKVSFENRTGQVLPFDAERMLADVQRVYYPWLDGSPDCSDCVRRGRRGGFEIEEHRTQGQVSRRRFKSLAAGRDEEGVKGGKAVEAGARLGIVVEYSGDPAFGGLLRDARLRHEEFGYEVELETLRIDWID